MQIDMMTTVAATTTLLVILGCQLLFFWSQDRRSTWLAWLTVPFALGALGVAVTVWRWKQQDFVFYGVGSGLLLGAFGMLWLGLRIFERRPQRLLPVIGPVGAWLALSLWPVFAQSVPLRVAIISAAMAVYCGLGVAELWRGRDEKLPSRLPLAMVLGIYAVLMIVRTIAAPFAPYPLGGLPINPIAVGAFNVFQFAFLSALAVLLICLTKERRELEQRNDALTDPLTGLANRRAFTAAAERIADPGKAERRQTSVLALDLDRFKMVNDRYGHVAGDRVLVVFAAMAETALRATDLLYRIGGEEFCFILPDTGTAAAIEAAERIRTSFERTAFDFQGESVRVTVSIGIATAEFAGFDLEVLLSAADAAMYEAKSRGRNRTIVADPQAIPRSRGIMPVRLAG